MNGSGDYQNEIVGIIGIFDGEVPYLKRGPQAKLYPGKWCIPSGHIKMGETPETAAVREFGEETGYSIADASELKKLGSFEYNVEAGKSTIKLNISLFLYMNGSKPEIRMCDEHTDSKYVSIELLSDQEKLSLVSRARGAEEFTPIDRLLIERYMPEAYRMYKSASVSRMKSTA